MKKITLITIGLIPTIYAALGLLILNTIDVNDEMSYLLDGLYFFIYLLFPILIPILYSFKGGMNIRRIFLSVLSILVADMILLAPSIIEMIKYRSIESESGYEYFILGITLGLTLLISILSLVINISNKSGNID